MSADPKRGPSGKYRKGFSGNPGGRPKTIKEVRALAQLKAPRVIEELFKIATDKKNNPNARVAACKELLNRAVGKAEGANMLLAREEDSNREIRFTVIDGGAEDTAAPE